MGWRNAAEAMLEGAARTSEAQGTFFQGNEEDPQACALGAMYLSFGAVQFAKDGYQWIDPSNKEQAFESHRELQYKYLKRYGSLIGRDNDNYGRDHVLKNVKELLNEYPAEDY